MRFQKRIKIAPGITINLSKSGASTSFGVTGARVTYGHGKRRTTIGLPGSGLSHTQIDPAEQAKHGHIQQPKNPDRAFFWLIAFLIGGAVFSLFF